MAQSIQIGNGAGGQIDLSVVEKKVKENLAMSNIGSLYGAMYESMEGSTFKFRSLELAAVKDYDATDKAGTAPNMGNIDLEVNKQKSILIPIETFDLSGLTTEDIVSRIVSNVSRSIAAFMDCEFIDTAVGALKQSNTTVDNKIDLVTATDAEIKAASKKYAKNSHDIVTTINKEHIGTPTESVVNLMNDFVKSQLAEVITSGETGANATLTGSIPTLKGFPVASHNFIGQNIQANQSFNGTKAYDFSNLQVLSFNRQAVAGIVNKLSVEINKDPYNQNFIVSAKFQYGTKVIEPTLIRAIVKDNSALPAAAVAMKATDTSK